MPGSEQREGGAERPPLCTLPPQRQGQSRDEPKRPARPAPLPQPPGDYREPPGPKSQTHKISRTRPQPARNLHPTRNETQPRHHRNTDTHSSSATRPPDNQALRDNAGPTTRPTPKSQRDARKPNAGQTTPRAQDNHKIQDHVRTHTHAPTRPHAHAPATPCSQPGAGLLFWKKRI